MTDLEFMNMITTIVAAHVTVINYPADKVKYPNADIDQDKMTEFVEILVNPLIGIKTNLSGSKRIFGCITFKVLTPRSIGSARAITVANQFAECLSNKIIDGVVFDQLDLKILDHTLSQRQTTTSINSYQVNANIEYSYMR